MFRLYKSESDLIVINQFDIHTISFLANRQLQLLGQGELKLIGKICIDQGIKKIILLGDYSMIPSEMYFIKGFNEKAIRICSDYKFGVFNSFQIPVVRYLKDNNSLKIICNKQVLIIVDRPLQYHMDAYYFYHMIGQTYNVDVCDGNKNNKVENYLDQEYDIVVHYGHSNRDYFIYGNSKTNVLPKTNILISHGCNSLQLVSKKKIMYNAFCGFSYYCYGQTPMNGSNRLVMYILEKLIQGGEALSEAILEAKIRYSKENICASLNKCLVASYSNKEFIDLLTIISCNTIADSNLNIRCSSRQNDIIVNNEKLLLPEYSTILLIIVCENHSEKIVLHDNSGNKYNIHREKQTQYGIWDEPIGIIFSFYRNEVYLLLNNSFKYIEINGKASIKQYFDS